MAASTGSCSSSSNFSEQWTVITTMIIFACGFLGYIIYDAIMATASELLHRLLVISPLLLIIVVHWLSTVPPSSRLSIPLPGSEPGAIHRAGASPWGVAFLLLLLYFLISYQPSLFGFLA